MSDKPNFIDTESHVSRRTTVALIFGEYNLPTQPYLKIWSDSLSDSKHLIIRNFSTRRTKDHQVKNFGDLTRWEKITRLAIITFKHWGVTQKYLSTHDDPFRVKISRLSKYAPLLEFDPKIVHLVNSYLYPSIAPLLISMGCKSIVSFRGYDIVVRPWNDKEWMLTLKCMFDHVDTLHFVSNYLKEEAIKLGAPKEKCCVIYPSTSETLFYGGRSLASEKNTAVNIVSIGRLTWQKGFSQGILAIKTLLDRGENVEYWILGDGYDREHLNYLIRDLGLIGKVHLLGQCSQDFVKQTLQNSEIYFHPSESEAIPVSLIEAALMGKAIVASKVGGIPEAILNEVTGLLVLPFDIEQMAQAITLLIHNSQLRKTLGENAQKIARERFSVKREISDWENLYTGLTS